MKILDEVKLDFDDVLITPRISQIASRADVNLSRWFPSPDGQFNRIPIIAANMDTVGTPAMAKALAQMGLMTALHKFNSPEVLAKSIAENPYGSTFYSLGATQDDGDKLQDFTKNHFAPPMIMFDVANLYSQKNLDALKVLRDNNPRAFIIAGNVCTPNIVEMIIKMGVQVVKTNIGPGHFCETRQKTGVGYPNLSCSIECGLAAHELGGYICSDGGYRYPGDIAKGLAAGADFIMIGSMLAGTDECDGEWSTIGHRVYKYHQYKILGEGVPLAHHPETGTTFLETHKPELDNVVANEGVKKALKVYGMSSKEAMEKHGGSEKDYRASEGRSEWVSYKGGVKSVVDDILGGLRSTCSYVGVANLEELPKKAVFVRQHRR